MLQGVSAQGNRGWQGRGKELVRLINMHKRGDRRGKEKGKHLKGDLSHSVLRTKKYRVRWSCTGLPGSKANGGCQRPLRKKGSFGNKLGSQEGQTGSCVVSCKRTFSVASRCALSLPSDPDATTCLAWRAM